MKIAYLIMAHADAPQLLRLISSLFVNDVTDFFVHIDKKSDITTFRKELASLPCKISFVENRVNTTWGGYSQVVTYQRLIGLSIDSGVLYDRVFLLSGLDYPLWSNSRLIEFLEANPSLELMKLRNISEPVSQMVKFKCTIYHFFRDFQIRRSVHRYIMWGARKIMTILPIRKKPYIFTNGKRNNIYFSSTWFCLTGNCIRYAYKELTENLDWEHYFKYSYAPDEMVLATIIGNSVFGQNAIQWKNEDGMGLVGVTQTHYIEYDTHIHIYDENDYRKLIDSDKMFVRKLTSEKSLRLIQMIDEYRKL